VISGVRMRRPATLLLMTFALSVQADPRVDAAVKRWSESPHGAMLERLIPPGYAPAQLPESASRGAQLTMQYCVQCHHLANPAMHHAQKWQPILRRMVLRMEGRGNRGRLMSEMMDGVQAPTPEEARLLLAYLQKHAQKPLDERRLPAVNAPEGEAFRLACQQCHVLPDPQRYTAKEWPAVTARMERNMQWMNRVVGSQPVNGEPQLRIEEINAFLAKYARDARSRARSD